MWIMISLVLTLFIAYWMDIYTRIIPTQKPFDFIFDHRKIKQKKRFGFPTYEYHCFIKKKGRKTYKYENIFRRNTQGLL